ncbi:tetratricopeptide repeat protein [Burkholderia cepacia]|nr:hypothetical protein [Burkholderia cepacia]MBY4735773.1 hypothetical protein [Burkholderia cepacia]MBY4742741.1 hypothetical protein [Burkholderia cepacia]MBY4756932.1 hypothetical protein [Burkholderia cepacia]MBY4772107.1 hypothetical protein [Burkholderia cepacia]
MKYHEARISLLYALARLRDKTYDAAFTALEDALRYAQANDMIGSFVDEGKSMPHLLGKWARDTPDLRRNFVTNQAVSLSSILSESSQARRTVAGSW